MAETNQTDLPNLNKTRVMVRDARRQPVTTGVAASAVVHECAHLSASMPAGSVCVE
jgi:hypothetical protein